MALAGAGCGKSTPASTSGSAGGSSAPPAASTAAPDTGPTAALWAFAPTETTSGLVADGRALAALGAEAEDAPAGTWQARLLSLATRTEPADLERCGIDLQLGAAYFNTTAGAVWVVPTATPDRFAACHHGTIAEVDGMTCATRRGRYVCADQPALLDQLGRNTATIRDRWPVRFRGDAEAWASPAAFAAERVLIPSPLYEAGGPAFAAVQVARGAVTFRAHATFRWISEVAAIAGKGAPVSPRGTSGFLALGVGSIVDRWAQDTPRIQLLDGITSRDAIHALDGNVQARVPSGTAALQLRFGLATPGVFRSLVARCDDVVSVLGLQGHADGDACRVDVTAGGATIRLVGRVEGDELRVRATIDGINGHATPVALTPIGGELGNGTWTFAAWGRGSAMLLPWQRFGRDVPGPYLARLAMVSEVGVGVRIEDDGLTALVHVRLATASADDVVRALGPLAIAMAQHREVSAQAKAIAARFPNSPFAEDLRDGWRGLAPAMLPWAAMYLDLWLAHRR